jgi:diguanylate cyclase (GGDEF)-like protein
LILAALACWGLIHRNMRLVRSASHMLERRVEERTEEIRHMAAHDALTGLPNRIMLREKTEDGLTRVRRGEGLAVLCLDLDHFKTVNDTLGHPVGDALLKSVTRRLQACAREIDTVARLGGDEFVILQADVKGPAEAGALGQRIIDSIAQPFEIKGHQVIIEHRDRCGSHRRR